MLGMPLLCILVAVLGLSSSEACCGVLVFVLQQVIARSMGKEAHVILFNSIIDTALRGMPRC